MMPPCSADFTIFTVWLWMMVCWTSYFLACLSSWCLHVGCLLLVSADPLPPSLFCGPWQMTGFCSIGLGQWETQQGLGDKQMVGNELHISLTSFFSLMVLLCSTGWPMADLPASASLTIGKPCIFHLSDRCFFLSVMMLFFFILFPFLGCSDCS